MIRGSIFDLLRYLPHAIGRPQDLQILQGCQIATLLKLTCYGAVHLAVHLFSVYIL